MARGTAAAVARRDGGLTTHGADHDWPTSQRLDALAAERGIALRHDAPMAPLTTLRVGGRGRPAGRGAEPRRAARRARAGARGGGSVVRPRQRQRPGGRRRRHPRTRHPQPGPERGDRRRSGCTPTPARRWPSSSGARSRRASPGWSSGSSIPGTLGGAVWANAGAHGGEMRDVLVAVEAWDPANGERRDTLDEADCALRLPRVALQAPSRGRRRRRPSRSSRTSPDAIAARVAEHQAQRVGDPATRRPERGERLPQPAGRPRRPPDRRGRAEGPAASGSASVSTPARELHRDRSRRPRRRRACASATRCAPPSSTRFGIELAVRDRVRRRLGAGRMSRRLRVGIFAGGRSAEHEVSIALGGGDPARDRPRSLRAVPDLHRSRRALAPPRRPGASSWASDSLAELLGAATPAEHTPGCALGRPAAPGRVTIGADLGAARGPALAGRGDRRRLPGASTARSARTARCRASSSWPGIPYTGAGVLASAVAMDKVVFKDLMRGHGLPVVDYAWFRRGAGGGGRSGSCATSPSRSASGRVVKPARLGSSVGMTLVHGPGELPAAHRRGVPLGQQGHRRGLRRRRPGARVRRARQRRPARLRAGRGDQPPRAVRLRGQVRRRPGRCRPRAPRSIRRSPPGVKELALAAYRAVDCAGLARVDFLAPPDDGLPLRDEHAARASPRPACIPKQAELAGLGLRGAHRAADRAGLASAREGRTPGNGDPPAER